MPFAKWRPICLGLYVWRHWARDTPAAIRQITLSNVFYWKGTILLFFYLVGLCLLAKLRNTDKLMFRKFWGYVAHDAWQLSRPFDTRLNSFTVPELGVTSCLLAIFGKNGRKDFRVIFGKGRLSHEEQSETFGGCWMQDYLFLFSGSVFVRKMMDGEWIFRNFAGYVAHWHPEQLIKTVARLTRVFQIPQTRRHRGLRSLNSSRFFIFYLLFTILLLYVSLCNVCHQSNIWRGDCGS